MENTTNKFFFRTNVLLKSIIGKDLINNDNIAVLELVKNSFDARSPRVEVVFKNLKENDDKKNESYSDKSSKLFIKDYGTGMSLEDIKDKWLNIAFSDKKYAQKEGSILAGAKGVGRFSCDRLGEYLDLYTKKIGEPIYQISIDWKDFEVENKKDLKIQDVKFTIKEITEDDFTGRFEKKIEQGTFIEISKLRSRWVHKEEKKDRWNTNKILDLRRYLEKLINPNQAFGKDRFIVEMIAGEFKESDALKKEPEKINGIIENKIFEKLDFTTTVIEAEIPADGKIIKTTLTDKKRKIFEMEERNVEYRLLKGIKIVIFYLNPYAKAYFKRQTGIRSVNFGSIFLFINGFRVNPLGDSEDDWLRMEVRKGQGYAKFLGTREVIGRIEISDLAGNFKIISSREGVVKDEKFRQIVDIAPSSYKGFFYKTLKRLEKYVVEGLDWDKTPENIKEIEKRVDLLTWKYDPRDERYREKESVKNVRSLGLLNSIIQLETETGNILRIYINEELIEQLHFEQREKAKEKIDKLIKEYSRFGPGIIDEVTGEALKRVQAELKKTKNELRKTKIELAQVIKIKEQIEETLQKEKVRVKDLEEEKKEQQERIYFQQRHLESSSDYKQIVDLLHLVGITSDTISGSLASLREDVGNDSFSKKKLIEYIESLNLKEIKKKIIIDREVLLEYIESLNFENNKVKVVADMVAQARFNAASPELKKGNLTRFIIQYINEVSKLKTKNFNQKTMVVQLSTNRVIEDFILDFNWIEIAMIFDNLFNNSRKSQAKNIWVEIVSNSKELTLKIRDDGIGIPYENRQKIFEFGFSTTYGTGLGLNHVKEILENIKGEIILNEKLERGCEFIIKVKK
ncbi:MAG: ATP-binding protein [Candidatus Aminicenantes bacterium]|nr:ATP-binding protein [Candidatus Aminicenantes bacterium]